MAAKEAELLTYVKFAKADSEQIQDLKAQLESSQNEVARLVRDDLSVVFRF